MEQTCSHSFGIVHVVWTWWARPNDELWFGFQVGENDDLYFVKSCLDFCCYLVLK